MKTEEIELGRRRTYFSSLTARLRRASRAASWCDSGESNRSIETSGSTAWEKCRRHLCDVLVSRRISLAANNLESGSSDRIKLRTRWIEAEEDEEIETDTDAETAVWSNSWSTSPPRGESQSWLVSIDDMDEEEEEATVEARLLVSPATSISERKKKDLFEIERDVGVRRWPTVT